MALWVTFSALWPVRRSNHRVCTRHTHGKDVAEIRFYPSAKARPPIGFPCDVTSCRHLLGAHSIFQPSYRRVAIAGKPMGTNGLCYHWQSASAAWVVGHSAVLRGMKPQSTKIVPSSRGFMVAMPAWAKDCVSAARLAGRWRQKIEAMIRLSRRRQGTRDTYQEPNACAENNMFLHAIFLSPKPDM